MNLLEVLQGKAREIVEAPTPFAVTFTEEDFLALSDVNQLRAFKLTDKCNTVQQRSADLFKCKEECNEDNLYKVLEFCTLANPAIRGPVGKVFQRLQV